MDGRYQPPQKWLGEYPNKRAYAVHVLGLEQSVVHASHNMMKSNNANDIPWARPWSCRDYAIGVIMGECWSLC